MCETRQRHHAASPFLPLTGIEMRQEGNTACSKEGVVTRVHTGCHTHRLGTLRIPAVHYMLSLCPRDLLPFCQITRCRSDALADTADTHSAMTALWMFGSGHCNLSGD
jgi:hypothetical protein